MLNIVFVCFTHGIALPILFPIGLFGILNYYISERILLAYYYKQPASFDMKISLMALKSLRGAPAWMMAFGYWYLGNR